jgi:hypothetical protein
MSVVGHKRTCLAELQCPLYSQKRTSLSAAAMSALCQKATSNGLLDRFLKSIKSRVIYCKAMVHAGNTDKDLKTNLYSLKSEDDTF